MHTSIHQYRPHGVVKATNYRSRKTRTERSRICHMLFSLRRSQASKCWCPFMASDFSRITCRCCNRNIPGELGQYHIPILWPWWRHQMETFSALLAICAANSPVTGEFPSQRPMTRSFDVFLDPRLNKRFSKQPRRRWFETPSRPLWRHFYGTRSSSAMMVLTM